jgi:transaldolase
MSKLHEAAGLGQSIWLNGVDRPLIHSHRLLDLIKLGVHGVTSHPILIANALAESSDYDHQLTGLVREGKQIKQIEEKLLFTDMQTVADLIHPIYERTYGVDGYISLDVNPALEHDLDELVSEGLRLVYDVDRVNVMVQIPATDVGIEAIQKLIGEGINVNATHIYTIETYEKVARAYIAGLDYFWTHLDIWRLPPAAVATLPVTRLDQAVSVMLNENDPLPTTAGIATAKVIYDRFQSIFGSKDWKDLAKHKSRLQRPLWASSEDPHYVDNLLGANTVHSLPLVHITVFLDGNPMIDTLSPNLDKAKQTLADLDARGIDLQALEQQLQTEAVQEIRQGYHQLSENTLRRRDALAKTL